MITGSFFVKPHTNPFSHNNYLTAQPLSEILQTVSFIYKRLQTVSFIYKSLQTMSSLYSQQLTIEKVQPGIQLCPESQKSTAGFLSGGVIFKIALKSDIYESS